MLIEVLYHLEFDKNYKGVKITCSYIASKVGCANSTISREIKKGKYKKLWTGSSIPSERYAYDVAQRISLKNQKRSHYSHKENQLITMYEIF